MKNRSGHDPLGYGNSVIVWEVAEPNDYRHLSLFNGYFRKKYGLTPTECRQQERRRR